MKRLTRGRRNAIAGARKYWWGLLGPGPARSARTCVIHEEALLRPLHSRLRRRPVRGHAQKPLGGVGFPSHARTPAWVDEAGLPARAQSRGRAALGAGRSGAGPSRAGRGLEVIPELRRRLRPCGETESGRRPRLWLRRRRQRELGPETRGLAVGPRNEVSAGPAAANATGAGRNPTGFRAGATHLCLQRNSGPGSARTGPGPPSCSRRGCRSPDPRKPGRAPGSWSSRALCFKSLMGSHSGLGWTFTPELDRQSCCLGNSVQRGKCSNGGVDKGREMLTRKWFPVPADWPQSPARSPRLFELSYFTPGALCTINAPASLRGPAHAGRSSNAGHKTIYSFQTASTGWEQSCKLWKKHWIHEWVVS